MSSSVGMPEGSRRKRRKVGLRYSSKKQLEKSKMAKRLHRAHGAQMSSTVRTLSYEEPRGEVEDFPSPNSSTQHSSGTNATKLDCVDESEENVCLSSPTTIDMLLSSAKLVSSSTYCCN